MLHNTPYTQKFTLKFWEWHKKCAESLKKDTAKVRGWGGYLEVKSATKYVPSRTFVI